MSHFMISELDEMETCEDRDYRCCEHTPELPDDIPGPGEDYEDWYARHVSKQPASTDAVSPNTRTGDQS